MWQDLLATACSERPILEGFRRTTLQNATIRIDFLLANSKHDTFLGKIDTSSLEALLLKVREL